MFLCWWAGVGVEVGNGESRTGGGSQEAQVLERSATGEKNDTASGKSLILFGPLVPILKERHTNLSAAHKKS